MFFMKISKNIKIFIVIMPIAIGKLVNYRKNAFINCVLSIIFTRD